MFQAIILVAFLPMIFGDCPENGIKWKSKCYTFTPKGVPFVTADLNCNQLGGNLASVHDGFTNAFLAQEGLLEFKKIKAADFWIGVTNLIIPGNWSWTDGTPYDFSEWRVSKEKEEKSGQSCGAININDGLWNSDDCFKAKPYVCESDDSGAPAAPTTTTTVKVTVAPIQTTSEMPIEETTSYSPVYIGCPAGWQSYGSFCYALTSTSLTWSRAESECLNNSSHLASIHNADELNFTQGLNGDWNWIGLHSNDNKTTWQWTDNTAFDFAPWASDMPQGWDYTCVHSLNVTHNDWDCSRLLYGICKKSAYALF